MIAEGGRSAPATPGAQRYNDKGRVRLSDLTLVAKPGDIGPNGCVRVRSGIGSVPQAGGKEQSRGDKGPA